MSNIIHNIKAKLSGSHSPTHESTTNESNKTQEPSVGRDNDHQHHHDNENNHHHDNTKGKQNDEPTFSILPHPAKTNDPADLQPGGGLRSSNGMDMFNAPGPYVPKDDIKNNLPAPLSHEELQARQAALRSEVPGHGTQQGNIL